MEEDIQLFAPTVMFRGTLCTYFAQSAQPFYVYCILAAVRGVAREIKNIFEKKMFLWGKNLNFFYSLYVTPRVSTG